MKKNQYVGEFEKKMLKRKILTVFLPVMLILLLAVGSYSIYTKFFENNEEDTPSNNIPNSIDEPSTDNTPFRRDENKQSPSSTVTTTTKVLDDGTTVVTTDVEAPDEEIDILGIEDKNSENKEEEPLVGNGEGEDGVDVPTMQNRIENDILYDRPISMYSMGNLNVRLTPIIADNIIALKEPGEKIDVIGESEDGEWFRIKYGDWYAYVIKAWVSPTKDYVIPEGLE